MSAGPTVMAVGLALLSLATQGSSYLINVLPALVVFGLGMAIWWPAVRYRDKLSPRRTRRQRLSRQHDVSRFGGLLAVAARVPAAGTRAFCSRAGPL